MLRKGSALLLAAMLLWTASAAYAENLFTVLLIGTDARDSGARGRSDTMILAQVDVRQGEVRMASFLRSLYVSIPGCGKESLNAAFRFGGEELLKQTLEETFGVSIDRTVTVDFGKLIELVDDLGGIELEITPEERAEINKMVYAYGDSPVPGDGVQTLDGAQALCFSRIRRIDSDIQRVSRQQRVVQAMARQLTQLSTWDALQLAIAHMDGIHTDVTVPDLLDLLPVITGLEEVAFHTFVVPQPGSYEGRVVDGSSVKIPRLERCRTELHAFLAGEE